MYLYKNKLDLPLLKADCHAKLEEFLCALPTTPSSCVWNEVSKQTKKSQ